MYKMKGHLLAWLQFRVAIFIQYRGIVAPKRKYETYNGFHEILKLLILRDVEMYISKLKLRAAVNLFVMSLISTWELQIQF